MTTIDSAWDSSVNSSLSPLGVGVASLQWKTTWSALGIVSALDSTLIPPEAIITLKNWIQIVSQLWLAKQPPPWDFTSAGWEIYPQKWVSTREKTDKSKMQCWYVDGSWYWNQLGRDWLARKMGCKIPTMQQLDNMLNENTFSHMQIATTGIYSTKENSIWGGFDEGFLPSSTENESPHNIDADIPAMDFLHVRTNGSKRWMNMIPELGAVPFFVIKKAT